MSAFALLSLYYTKINDISSVFYFFDEILYFVSSGKPVIAMKNSSQAVLINAYTSSSVSWFDPSTGATTKMSPNGAERFFENAGYVFISYI